jgi:hypothetical protein
MKPRPLDHASTLDSDPLHLEAKQRFYWLRHLHRIAKYLWNARFSGKPAIDRVIKVAKGNARPLSDRGDYSWLLRRCGVCILVHITRLRLWRILFTSFDNGSYDVNQASQYRRNDDKAYHEHRPTLAIVASISGHRHQDIADSQFVSPAALRILDFSICSRSAYTALLRVQQSCRKRLVTCGR